LHIEQTLVVKAPREQVFQAWTDYENWPRYFDFFTRVTVTERAGNTALLDTEVKFMGRDAKRAEKHVLTPPERVDVEGEMEGMTNTTVWKFESVPQGTRLTAIVEARLPLRLRVLGPLARRRLQVLLRESMQGLAK
jgi:uncharacterized protein YndB with AHSA1/START domain